MIFYRVHLEQPRSHLFRIELVVPASGLQQSVFSMPAWLPGSYMVRDFARHLSGFSATDAHGQPLAWRKLDKQRWQVDNGGQPIQLGYWIYAFDRSVRGAHFDTGHAYFNGSSLFLCLEGAEKEPSEMEVLPPIDDSSSWQLLTSMRSVEVDSRGFGRYQAESYARLIDHPVEIGTPQMVMFTVEGVPHRLAVTGRHFADLTAIAQALKSICSVHCQLFGELPLEEQYLFLLQVMDQGYGGLEHRSSTSLLCARADVECSANGNKSSEYRQFLALCSHEYFHLWNGKRISPAKYLDPDLSQEVHSQLLWLVEGVTSYYDELSLLRAGVIDLPEYLEMLAQAMTRYFKGSGRYRQSLAESSFDAWTKFYKQDENAPNSIVSYYVKGGLVVLMLDLLIRQSSDGEFSFDDVMRYLWREFGRQELGIPEHAVPQVIEAAIGLDLSAELQRWVHGTDPIEQPLQQLLASVGVGFRLRPPVKMTDPGGYLTDPGEVSKPTSWLGAAFQVHTLGLQLTQVFSEGPAERAGLCANDVLLAMGGLRLTTENLERQLTRFAGQTRVMVHLFRADELLAVELEITSGPAYVAELWLDPEANQQQLERRAQWLHSIS